MVVDRLERVDRVELDEELLLGEAEADHVLEEGHVGKMR